MRNDSLEARLLGELQEAVSDNKEVTATYNTYYVPDLLFQVGKYNSFEKFRTVYWVKFIHRKEKVYLEGDYWNIYNFLKDSYDAQNIIRSHNKLDIFIAAPYPHRILGGP